MRESEHAVSIAGLSKYYGDHLAVDRIHFEVHKGEFFGFLGPNGAGKTTTVNMLTGVTSPTDGTASVFGRDVVRESFRAKELMGIVPEVSNAYAELSGWDNLVFTGALYGVPRDVLKIRATELLQEVGLHDQRKQKVKKYSMGMRRRLVIAMALVNRPQILFLDEPTSGLDVQSVLTIHEMIRTFNRNGTTVFMTTHNMEEASKLCDRVAIINRGRIAAIDTPRNLKRTIQSVQSVEVSFEGPPVEHEKALASLKRVNEVKRLGDRYRLFTDEPSALVEDVTDYARRTHCNISYINTPGPSLEDVFIRLTGIEAGGPGEGGQV